MQVLFREMKSEDWIPVAEIYLQGIRSGNATFETEVPSWEKWDSSHLKLCRITALLDGEIVAWAALVPVSARKVYSGVAEVSIYVSESHKGKGIGRSLLEKLISESETEGFWTLQAVIFPENLASLKIHQDLGFRKVGFREKIAKMNSVWRDTVLLEKRSKKKFNIT
jgi:L-amino acid N-acyltransferase YncA